MAKRSKQPSQRDMLMAMDTVYDFIIRHLLAIILTTVIACHAVFIRPARSILSVVLAWIVPMTYYILLAVAIQLSQ